MRKILVTAGIIMSFMTLAWQAGWALMGAKGYYPTPGNTQLDIPGSHAENGEAQSFRPVLHHDSISWFVANWELFGIRMSHIFTRAHPDSIYDELYFIQYSSFNWQNDSLFLSSPVIYYSGKIREDTISGKLWYVPPPPTLFPREEEEFLIMDLSLSVGDTFQFRLDQWNTVDSIYFLDDGRKVIRFDLQMDIWGENVCFIEGVGPNVSVIYRCSYAYQPYYVTCKYHDNEVVYVNSDTVWFDDGIPLPKYFVGLNSALKDSRVRVYPNPARDFLHVDIDHSLLPTSEIVIHDVHGIVLKHEHLHGYNHTISLGGLNHGFYFVSIKNGHHRHRHKIIINR